MIYPEYMYCVIILFFLVFNRSECAVIGGSVGVSSFVQR